MAARDEAGSGSQSNKRTHGEERRLQGSRHGAGFSEVDELNPTGNRGVRLGGSVERGPLVVERWLRDRDSEAEMGEGFDEEDRRFDRRSRDRMPVYERQRGLPRREAEFEVERRRERHNSRGPRKSKIDFPHFNGGDPHEWLEKVEHYFWVYDVIGEDRVSMACIYLDGKANSWWRWIRAQYEQNGRRMGWTTFEKEFMAQWGPSPVVNHHGCLAKLKHEERVHSYIEEFHRLQTMVRGWSEKTLVGTFIEGLKPWLARGVKLKQPNRLVEAMKIVEVMGDSHYEDRKPSKESNGSKFFELGHQKIAGTEKEADRDRFKKDGGDVRKLSWEEVQERIKKGLCFKCSDKWGRDHKCKIGKVYFVLDSSDSNDHGDERESESNDDGKLRVIERVTKVGEAEVLLNAITRASTPSTMRLMAWIGKFEITDDDANKV
ncbi:hypothetical protein ACOSQ3_005832 [Xanthoceras sorbifolium]